MHLGLSAAACLVLGAALAAPVSADDVHLTNGKVFEGVVAEWRGDRLVMQIPGGEMTLARSSVQAVVPSSGGYAAFLMRQRELVDRGGATAPEWLELARLAVAANLEQPARTAALEAAALDPRLPGLAPLLTKVGYAWDERGGRWLPYAEVMRRRGYVFHEGGWITREEAALRRADAAARQHELAMEQTARMERSLLAARIAAAELDLRRAAAPPPPSAVVVVQSPQLLWPTYFVPVAVPVAVPAPNPGGPAQPVPVPVPHPGTSGRRSGLPLDIVTRQPGSLLPARWESGGGHP